MTWEWLVAGALVLCAAWLMYLVYRDRRSGRYNSNEGVYLWYGMSAAFAAGLVSTNRPDGGMVGAALVLALYLLLLRKPGYGTFLALAVGWWLTDRMAVRLGCGAATLVVYVIAVAYARGRGTES